MTPPTLTVARPEVVTEAAPRPRAPWIERATSPDHKSVGLLYMGGAIAFLCAAVAELVLMRVQLIAPENTVMQPQIFDRLLSVNGATVVVLFALPLVLGLISYLVPLQIGARGVAFPRLGLLSAWLFLFGGFILYLSFLWRPPEAGFASLPPLGDDVFTPTNGVNAWIVGVALAVLGFVLFAVNMAVTVGNMRAPGMAWRRLPIFSWAATVISYVLLVAGPAMLAALTMLCIDRNFGGGFFDSQQNGSPLYYEHLSWIFFTGAYVIMLLFAFGVISEILPIFARKPLFSHGAAMGSLAAIAPLGVLAWMQNMYTAPLPIGVEIFAMLCAVALVVPIGLLFFNWIATLWGGALSTRAAPLFAIAAISTITFGLVGELAYSVIPVGWQLNNTTAAQGDTAFVVVGAMVLGGFAALHYWFPKLCGRVLGEGMGKASLATIVLGVQLYAWPMFLAGLKGQPVDIYKYFQGYGLDTFNLIASIGFFILAIGIVIGLVNAAGSWVNGVPAGHDPWGGGTLEWFALSPPALHNFDAVPDVRSARPMYDIREGIARRLREWSPPHHAEPPPSPEDLEAQPAEAPPTGGPPADELAEHEPRGEAEPGTDPEVGEESGAEDASQAEAEGSGALEEETTSTPEESPATEPPSASATPDTAGGPPEPAAEGPMSGEDTHESSTEAPSRALAEAGEPSAGAEADPASPEDTDRGSAPEGGAEESVETASQETSADEDDDGSTGETRPVA